MPSYKNSNKSHREFERHLNISEDVFMYQLSIIKSARKYHDKSNVVCEELKSKLKVTDQPVVDIG